MLERSYDLLRPGGYVIGQLPTVSSWENKLFLATIGAATTPEAPSDPF